MWTFFLNSILLGLGLTMDAFSVSIADGLNEPCMKKLKMIGIAASFAIFQFAMPLLGWVCVHTVVNTFKAFRYAIPWIALVLLGFIGGKMFYENLRPVSNENEDFKKLGILAILLQAIATSIDALSVGFTISEYSLFETLGATGIIGGVTFLFCTIGLFFGNKLSSKFSRYASLIGGLILIAIGLEVCISNCIELFA